MTQLAALEAASKAATWWEAARGLALAWHARTDPTEYPYSDAAAWNALSDAVRTAAAPDAGAGPAVLVELADLFTATAGALTVDTAIHAVCNGICLARGDGFSWDWRQQVGGSTFRPQPGDPIPLAYRRTSTPSMFPPVRNASLDLFSHIGRAPEPMQIGPVVVEAEYDFSLEDLLAGLDVDAIPATSTMHLNEDHRELTWPDGHATTPIGIGPKDPAAQLALATRAVEAATDRGSLLVVGTECADHSDVSAGLVKNQDAPGAPVIIAGSRHVAEDGVVYNIAYLLVGGLEVEVHRKIVPIGAATRKDHTEEGIERGNLVRIFVAGRTRLAVLICRDFLEEALTHFLRQHSVNLLCVVSLTPTLAPFIEEARPFSSKTQGVVIVANGPAVIPDPPYGPKMVEVDVNPPAVLAVPLSEDNMPVAPRPDGVRRGVTHLDPTGSVAFEAL